MGVKAGTVNQGKMGGMEEREVCLEEREERVEMVGTEMQGKMEEMEVKAGMEVY